MLLYGAKAPNCYLANGWLLTLTNLIIAPSVLYKEERLLFVGAQQ